MDRVYTVHDWWDGPLLGLAAWGEAVCIYERVFSETLDEYTDLYRLTLIPPAASRSILAEWEAWLDWMAEGPSQDRAVEWSRRSGRIDLASAARRSAVHYLCRGVFTGSYVNGYTPLHDYFVQWEQEDRAMLYDSDPFFTAYAAMPRSREGLSAAGEWHQLKPLFPDLAGKAVLDLGCGYGWHCAYAAAQGASYVLGLDASRKMLDKAQQDHSGAAIEYRLCALEDYDYPPDAFDLVLSNLVLHYIRDLEAVYRLVWRTLRPSGVFLFNIEHPVFTAGVGQDWVYNGEGRALYWPVDNYYFPGERETNFLGHRVIKQHHTLAQILNPLPRLGFVLDTVDEAVPPEEMRQEMPDEMRRPMMLLVRAVKPV